MEDTLSMFYQVLGTLGARGGQWGAEIPWEFRPKVGNLPEREISTHQGVSSGEICGQ